MAKFNFEVNKQELNKYINRIAKNNISGLKKDFKDFGIDFNLWEQELKTELKWQRFIYFTYSNKIEIDEDFLERIKQNNKFKRNNLEINLSEIEVSK